MTLLLEERAAKRVMEEGTHGHVVKKGRGSCMSRLVEAMDSICSSLGLLFAVSVCTVHVLLL
jgi:hypothetical protein